MLAFSQPVFDMQRVFRAVLDAMSRPARFRRLTVFPQSVPDGLSPVLADLALTLCDGETPLWLSPGLRREEIAAWLRFHCGCPLVEGMDKASFALVADASELPPLSAFAQGEITYPDRSATVLLAGLAFDAGTRFRASGPGIRGEHVFTCALPEGFTEEWKENASGFPLGVDMLLCGADGVAGLPRTTRLERLPQEGASCM